MQIRIDSMEAKQITTSKGPSTLLKIKSGNEFYSTFLAKWNAGWGVGQTVEANVEINGKYKNLKPAGDAVKKGSDFDHKIKELEQRISRLEAAVLSTEPSREEYPPPYTDEDCPF